MASEKIVLSGIQPSGTLHLGNYLGAIKQWVALQENNRCYYCIVDLHAITVPYEPGEMLERILSTAALYIAAGVDPEKSTIFVQSHVSAHTELAWLLSTQTPFGELSRMTQFKDKSQKQADNTTLGLFAYPVLMAADILLYQAQVVPVGEDQKQHLELARNIAERFNNKYGEVFTVPAPHIPAGAARIMSLTDPTKKMSKSDTEKSYLALLDTPDVIRQKIMGATTETEATFSFENSGPAVRNLLTIYQTLTGEEPVTIEKQFAGQGFKQFKEALAEVIVVALEPLQTKYKEVRENDDDLRILLGRGKHTAEQVANQTLSRAKEAMGLL